MKKTYSSIEAVLHNTLILHFNTLTLNIGNTACILEYSPELAEPSLFTSVLKLPLQVMQDLVEIEFSSLDLLKLHPDMKDVDFLAQFPLELQLALLEFISEDCLKNATKALNLPLTFLCTTKSLGETVFPFTFKLSYKDASKNAENFLFLRFWLNANTINLLIPKLKNLPPKKQDLSSMSLECAFLVGAMTLKVEEARGLEVGDVLIPPSLTHKTQKQVFLHFYTNTEYTYEEQARYNFAYLCSLEENTLTIVEQTNKLLTIINGESADMDTNDQETANAEKLDTQNINLQLTFELDKKIMTLAEVEALHVGTNILLDSDPLAPISINILNQPFAKGRVIDIDGRFALQITEITLKKD